MSENKPSVAFIGIGIMGASMAGHLLAAGHPLHVYNRTKSKTDDLVSKGATWHATAGDAAAAADVIITIVGFPSDVEAVYLGAGGIVEKAKPGALLIDMTTSSPELAIRIAEAATKKGQAALDAPVSGGDVGAKNAKLSIMVGGDKAAYDRALPIFQLMGTNITHQGGPGAGQHTKLSNQIVIASTIVGVCEGLSYAAKAGLDPKAVLAAIGTGAAGGFQLNVLGPRILDGDFAPGFMVEHFLKDMGIATVESERIGIALKGLAMAKAQFEELSAKGHARDGTQGLAQLYMKK